MVAKDHPMLPRLLSIVNGKKGDSDKPEFLISAMTEALKVFSSVTWEAMANNTAMGFVMSRLYQGNFDLDRVKQNFELTHKPKS